MMDLSQHTTICLDPTTSCYESEGVKLSDVWADELARMFYIAYSKQHLRSQYFLAECLDVARMIRELKPDSAKVLSRLIENAMHRSCPFCSQSEFAEAFWPYVKGEKKLSYTINPRQEESR